MVKIQLPIFAPEHTFINKQISYQKRGGKVYYFHYNAPIYSHDEEDIASFRYITSQLIVSGNVKEIRVAEAFGVSYISVKRGVKRLRQEGAQGFFKEVKRRGPHVFTPDVVEKAQGLLDKGLTPGQVGKKLDLKPDTIRKAIRDGRLHKKK